MKNFLLKLVAIALLAGIFHACNETLVEEPVSIDLELKSAQNGLQSYIVVLNDAELNAELGQLKGAEKREEAVSKAASIVLERAGISEGIVEHVYGTAIKGFSVKIPPRQLKKLENDPSVKYVEEDRIITLPFAKAGASAVEATDTETTPVGITRVNGGNTYTGSNVAWIIDTGIDLDHPDLDVDETRSMSVFTTGRDKSPDDGNGHGTHVAGTVAAIDNTEGVVGVAAGAKVIAVKVLDSRGSGSYSGVIEGVDYVAANGSAGDVANMSLGGPASDALDNAIINAASNGIKFSLAAGNDSDDANNYSPARASGTNIYTISAMDSNDNFASFSNYGNPPVDFCEPGVSIYSTYKDGSYRTLSGTSMAAPHMAGILLWGATGTDGNVKGDPDGNADAIGVVGGGVTTTGSIDGTVTDGTNPIEGASIVVENTTYSAISDVNGNYTISNIPTETYSVTAAANGYSSLTQTNVSVTENQSTTINFSLISIPTYTVSGTVTDGSAALEGALVEIEGTNLSAYTDVDGTYSVSGVENGDYTITASLSGYESSYRSISVNGNLTEIDFSLTEITTSPISLTATGSKVRGVRYVNLSWSGATGTVNIYRDGVLIDTVNASLGEYEDNLERTSGTFIYQVCETDGSACSNEVTVTI